MRAVSRVSLVLALSAATLSTMAPLASAAPIDCQYVKSKKLVTITIDNADTTGWLVIERELGTTRIGYTAEGDSWKGCEGARTTTTNKIKVVGSTLSEEIYLSLENGAFAPGASAEGSGASEIEFELDLGAGTDSVTLRGGGGADRLGFPKAGQAALNGDSDVDVAISGIDRWYIEGGEGNDVLDGRGAPSVQVFGNEGADRLTGGAGPDGLYGDDGGSPGKDDVLVGGDGDDGLYGYLGNDTLVGGDGDDSLSGYEGRDTVRGGAGDDGLGVMSTKDGPDLLDGGSGNDYVGFWDRTSNVKVSLDGKANDGGKNEGDNVLPNVERIYSGSGNDTLVGTDSYNRLDGGDGNDTIKGLGGDDDLDDDDGNDTVYGGAGNEYLNNDPGEDKYYLGEGDDDLVNGSSADGRDVFSGGPGDDSLTYANRTNAVDVDVTDPGNDGESGENDNVLADFERITGGVGSDTIKGSNRAEAISGGSGVGADLINGRGGADDLYGYDGNDLFVGGEGYDEIYGGTGEDSIDSLDEGEDYVDCGSGVTDTVSAADAFDSIVNCDIVPI